MRGGGIYAFFFSQDPLARAESDKAPVLGARRMLPFKKAVFSMWKCTCHMLVTSMGRGHYKYSNALVGDYPTVNVPSPVRSKLALKGGRFPLRRCSFRALFMRG